MRPSKRRSLAKGLFRGSLLALLFLPTPCRAGETLRIGGTGGALGTVRLLAESYAKLHPELSVQVLPSLGSGGAVKGMHRGVLDIGLTSRDLTEQERLPSIRSRAFARTPFLFATGTDSPVDDLSWPVIQDIYRRGESTLFPGARARIVLRPEKDSDTVLLRGVSPEMSRAYDAALARPGMFVAITAQEAADVLESTPYAFGTTLLSLVRSERRRLKIFSLEGVSPTLEHLADGSYPLGKTFFLLTASDAPAKVLDFESFLFSPEGERILAGAGNLPLGKETGR